MGLTAALTCVATADAHFVIVAYENRPGITRPCFSRVRRSLYSVTYRAGALAPGSHSADRPAWLERELENDSSSSISSAEVVIHATRVLLSQCAHAVYHKQASQARHRLLPDRRWPCRGSCEPWA